MIGFDLVHHAQRAVGGNRFIFRPVHLFIGAVWALVHTDQRTAHDGTTVASVGLQLVLVHHPAVEVLATGQGISA